MLRCEEVRQLLLCVLSDHQVQRRDEEEGEGLRVPGQAGGGRRPRRAGYIQRGRREDQHRQVRPGHRHRRILHGRGHHRPGRQHRRGQEEVPHNPPRPVHRAVQFGGRGLRVLRHKAVGHQPRRHIHHPGHQLRSGGPRRGGGAHPHRMEAGRGRHLRREAQGDRQGRVHQHR